MKQAQLVQAPIGRWQSFGTVTEPAGGGYTAQWTCEDYNMVFVKQSNGGSDGMMPPNGNMAPPEGSSVNARG